MSNELIIIQSSSNKLNSLAVYSLCRMGPRPRYSVTWVGHTRGETSEDAKEEYRQTNSITARADIGEQLTRGREATNTRLVWDIE
jgi:hypothetical protein